MKTLKFRRKLSEMVLNGEKTTTWRLFDDKNLQEGDVISLILEETGEEFAKAEITGVAEKRFEDLTEQDKEGQEAFRSDGEMYATFSGYYSISVNEKNIVKIIKFKISKS